MEEQEETVPDLLEPDEEKGEQILRMTDDIPFQNLNKEAVPELLEDKIDEEEEEIVTITDDIPFQNQNQTRSKATLV